MVVLEARSSFRSSITGTADLILERIQRLCILTRGQFLEVLTMPIRSPTPLSPFRHFAGGCVGECFWVVDAAVRTNA